MMRKLCLTRYPGGKSRLVSWIVGHMPEHRRYVEGYGGAINVLLGKAPSEEEIVIDKDLGMFTLIQEVRDHGRELARRMAVLTYDRRVFEEAQARLLSRDWSSDLDLAGLVYVVRRQSVGGMGRSYSYSDKRNHCQWWQNSVSKLSTISDRLRHVQVAHGDALEWLDLLDDHDTLAYLDPPYPHGTRTCRDLYTHEMEDWEHRRLLGLIGNLNGKVLISGYDSPIYRHWLEGWSIDTREVNLHAALAAKKTKRTEYLWANFDLGKNMLATAA